jgi:cytochrome c2
MRKVFKVLGILLLIVIIGVAGLLVYVKTALPNVGPPPDLKVEMTPERIKHGEYLANHVALCMECHSERDYTLWSGPVLEGTLGKGGEGFTKEMGFPGNYYAKNLTPYHLSTWTDGEIFRAITAGVNKDGKALFPIMQYQHFGKMDPEEIKDIIAYLRTLPSIKHDVPASSSDFPMNFIINTIPAKPVPGKRPAASDPVALGEYLTNAALCVVCHTKEEKGKIIGEPFAGGFEFGSPFGMIRSANITPDKETGIGEWTEQVFLTKFKSYADSNYHPYKVAPGNPMTVMPWTMFAKMDSSELKAIYAYLRTVKPVNSKVEKWTPTPPTAKK